MNIDRGVRLIGAGLSAWAIVGVPLAFLIYVELSYRYALSQGKLPFQGLSEWHWYSAFGICLASGVISLIKLPIFRHRNPFTVGILYAVLMGAVLFAIHLFVACGKGDCL